VALEYRTVQFANDDEGLAQRNAYVAAMANDGWHITSELIEQGHIAGGQACCLASICLPMVFLAGRTASQVTITFAREKMKFCSACGARNLFDAVYCANCGSRGPAEQQSASVLKGISGEDSTSPVPAPAPLFNVETNTNTSARKWGTGLIFGLLILAGLAISINQHGANETRPSSAADSALYPDLSQRTDDELLNSAQSLLKAATGVIVPYDDQVKAQMYFREFERRHPGSTDSRLLKVRRRWAKLQAEIRSGTRY
jgi:hypothetical protein